MDISSLKPMVRDGPNRGLLESIGTNAQILRQQYEEFQRALGPKGESEVVCFYEMVKSPTATKVCIHPPISRRAVLTRAGPSGQVANDRSACDPGVPAVGHTLSAMGGRAGVQMSHQPTTLRNGQIRPPRRRVRESCGTNQRHCSTGAFKRKEYVE